MGARGRKSGAELAVVSDIEEARRPKPPSTLTEEQAAEWWPIVNDNPADWFTGKNLSMLEQYCRHVVEARRIAQLIERVCVQEDLDISSYDQLLKMQERETRAINSLLRQMRQTQASTYDRRKIIKSSSAKKPWEDK